MVVTSAQRPRRSPRPDRRWAEVGDLALVVAREIQVRPYLDDRVRHLSPSEGMVMRHLHSGEAATPTSIAASVGLQRTNLSSVLRGLERKDLIERSTNPEDRRVVTVRLTERGRAHYEMARNEWAAAIAAAAGNDTGNLEAAIELLTRVKDGLIADRRG